MNEELHHLYLSPNNHINRVIQPRKGGCLKYVVRMGKTSDAYKILVGKPVGRRSLGRRSLGQEDAIRVVPKRSRTWTGLNRLRI
jgi:hypothetical protein